MKEKELQDIALFRYSVISPFLSDSELFTSAKEFFVYASGKTYEFNGRKVNYAPGTIENWYYTYSKHGFDGLKPKGRSDAGVPRKIDEDIDEAVRLMINDFPRLPATVIYANLQDNGLITRKDVSLSTITRFVSAVKSQKNITMNKDMRRYERAHINEVWCGDSTFGLKIDTPEGKKKAVIIALIDDASRMIVGIDIFFNDSYVNLMSVIKTAVAKYGVPSKFNFDNGKNYRNHQMNLLAARIGSALNYNPPYTPESIMWRI